MVHSQLCPKVSCDCPKRLAAGTVDSLLGKLNPIFNNIDNIVFGVKEYLKFVLEEQVNKAIVFSKAVPMLFVKFSTLINFLRHSTRCSTHLSLVNDNILVRDTVFFVVDFFH